MKFAPLFLSALAIILGSGATYWWSEARRLEGHSSKLASTTLELERRLERELTQERTSLRQSRADVARLETQLEGEIRRQSELSKHLKQQQKLLLASRVALNAARAKALRPMPEGVRLTLTKINKLLRQDGHENFRFVWAQKLQDRELYGVELLESDPETLLKTFYMPKRTALSFDRGTGQLAIELHGGSMLTSRGSQPIPDTGHIVVFEAIDGRTWETLLPQIVRAAGFYPLPKSEPKIKRLPRNEANNWIERIDRVLGEAKTPMRYRLERLAGLQDARFEKIVLLGYKKKLLATSAEARSLEFSIDLKADSVSLVLRDGILRKKGGGVPIPASGYRILLPGLTGTEVSEAMMGMVIRK